MQRVIKARAWDGTQWLYGDLLTPKPDDEFYYIRYVDEDGDCIATRVDGESVGELTGLLDKNDTPIFEGDIVKLTGNVNPKDEVVSWDEERCGFTPYCEQILSAADSYSEWSIDTSEFNGNIYENPDLHRQNILKRDDGGSV